MSKTKEKSPTSSVNLQFKTIQFHTLFLIPPSIVYVLPVPVCP